MSDLPAPVTRIAARDRRAADGSAAEARDDRRTPERLLAAAGPVFADRGFESATVREIVQRAGANIAAVNYHFGDKRGLYQAVFEHACTCPGAALVPTVGAPAERLHGYVHAMLSNLLDAARPPWHAKLLARELVEPTGMLDGLVQGSIRPQFEALQALVRALLGPRAAPETVRRAAGSVVAQCVFYHHSRPILARLDPDLTLDEAEIGRLAEHITAFSLAGLAALRRARRASSKVVSEAPVGVVVPPAGHAAAGQALA